MIFFRKDKWMADKINVIGICCAADVRTAPKARIMLSSGTTIKARLRMFASVVPFNSPNVPKPSDVHTCSQMSGLTRASFKIAAIGLV